MQVGDLVKEIYHGMIGLIFETSTEHSLMRVIFLNGTSRWLRRDSLVLVCK